MTAEYATDVIVTVSVIAAVAFTAAELIRCLPFPTPDHRRTTMASQKNLLEAVNAGDVRIVEISRLDTRDLIDVVDHDDLLAALDEAQGEADEPGKAVYVVLKINGSTL